MESIVSWHRLTPMAIGRVVQAAAVVALAGCDELGPKLVTVEVAPRTITLTSLRDTITLQATAKDSKGTALRDVTFTWSSSNPEVATVNNEGVATALANGRVTIAATADGVTGSASLTVAQRAATVNPSPSTARVPFGQTQLFTTTVLDARGNLIGDRTAVWTSQDTSIATIISPGRAKGVGLGATSVIAKADEATDTAAFAVDPIVIASVSTGGTHVCALTVEDVPYCWGDAGKIGDSSLVGRTAPEPVAGGLVFRFVSASRGLGSVGGHSCGVTSAGTAYCWGDNDEGQLGDGTTTSALAPVAVAGGLLFVAITAGGDHSCGLTGDGAAYCWGRNTHGQLGSGSEANDSTPVAVIGGLSFSTLDAGGDHTCGLTTDGAAYCWGDDLFGQLGDSASGTYRTAPVRVAGGHVFRSLTAGNEATCGIVSPGVAYCWGWNSSGELGDGTTTNRAVPTEVVGNLVFTAIDVGAGNGHTCGLTDTDAAYCWGNNFRGALGVEGLTMSTVPVQVSGGLSYRAISVGGFSFTCGLTIGGTAYCWGDNSSGQLGHGDNLPSSTPVAVKGQP